MATYDDISNALSGINGQMTNLLGSVSNITGQIIPEIESFHKRPIEDKYIYLYLDGITITVNGNGGKGQRTNKGHGNSNAASQFFRVHDSPGSRIEDFFVCSLDR